MEVLSVGIFVVMVEESSVKLDSIPERELLNINPILVWQLCIGEQGLLVGSCSFTGISIPVSVSWQACSSQQGYAASENRKTDHIIAKIFNIQM